LSNNYEEKLKNLTDEQLIKAYNTDFNKFKEELERQKITPNPIVMAIVKRKFMKVTEDIKKEIERRGLKIEA